MPLGFDTSRSYPDLIGAPTQPALSPPEQLQASYHILFRWGCTPAVSGPHSDFLRKPVRSGAR